MLARAAAFLLVVGSVFGVAPAAQAAGGVRRAPRDPGRDAG